MENSGATLDTASSVTSDEEVAMPGKRVHAQDA